MALCAATLSVSAQEGNTTEKNYTYEVRVVNPSGIPIKDAVVRAIETNVSATTDVNGLFSLTLPEKGDSIVITKEGLATFSGHTIEPLLKIIYKDTQNPDGGIIRNIIKDYVPLKKEVIVIGPLETSRMSVEAYAKKMAETAAKYFDAGQKFLSDATPDYMKAFACFTRAANMENDQAAYQLAKMYDEGTGIPQDQSKALKWYEKAQGILGVPLRMAVMYLEGIGTEQDDIKARNYLYVAISAGDSTEAPKLLKELYAKHADEMGDSESDKVYDFVETKAQFPGGDKECLKFINSQLKYPAKCQEMGIQGRVLVSFVVNKDGSIVDIKILRSPDPLLTKEAERVVSLMPKWIPAMQGWKNVRSRFQMPVMFRLN